MDYKNIFYIVFIQINIIWKNILLGPWTGGSVGWLIDLCTKMSWAPFAVWACT